MAIVVPTILAATPDEYAAALARTEEFSRRIHVDVTDGKFTDGRTINLAQVYVAGETELDLHLMLEDPSSSVETALSLKPKLVIFHYESKADLEGCITQVKDLGIKAGLAILPDTTAEEAAELIKIVDHVLVFTGHLGHNAGEMQEELLDKVGQAKQIKSELEVSVDGGVNAETVSQAVEAGADVLYVGSFIKDAVNPAAAYAEISRIAGEAK